MAINSPAGCSTTTWSITPRRMNGWRRPPRQAALRESSRTMRGSSRAARISRISSLARVSPEITGFLWAETGFGAVGPMKGHQAHGCFQVDGPDWGIRHAETVIEPTHFTTEKAIQMALDASERSQALSWNLLMYDDGSVSTRSLALVRQVGKTIRTKYSNG